MSAQDGIFRRTLKALGAGKLRRLGIEDWAVVRRTVKALGARKLRRLGIEDWRIEFPDKRNGVPHDEEGLLLKGWVRCAKPGNDVQLILQTMFHERRIEVDQSRPDISRALSIDPQQCHGFSVRIPPIFQRVRLYAEQDGERELISSLDMGRLVGALSQRVQLKPTAFEGTDGWLFLDGDTNSSRAQARGDITLTDSCLRRWAAFDRGLTDLAQNSGTKVAFLVVPSRERVLADRYPHLVAGRGLAKQLGDALPSNSSLVHPEEELIQLGDSSFLKTDTHWSYPGALAALQAVCSHFGIDGDEFASVFQGDSWNKTDFIGDLGSKMDPERHSIAELNNNSCPDRHKVYDNGLMNNGRVSRLTNDQALLQKHCLIFGGSSALFLLGFAIRIFRSVVFIHSVASVDLRLVEIERPDFLIAQTNERFLTEPANLELDIVGVKMRKCSAPGFDIDYVADNQVVPNDWDDLHPIYRELWGSEVEAPSRDVAGLSRS